MIHQVRIEEAVKNGAYLCGPPSQLIETLSAWSRNTPGSSACP
jgi:hypothetical protein